MGTSGSIPRENKLEEGKEQPYDNHPIRNREFTKITYKSLFSRIFSKKRTHVEDSSSSENSQLEVRKAVN